MESLKNLRSDCGQFILPIKTLQKISQNKQFKLLDVGGRTPLKKIPPEQHRIS